MSLLEILEIYHIIAFFQTPSLKSKRDRQDRYKILRFQTIDIKRKTAKNSLKNPRPF